MSPWERVARTCDQNRQVGIHNDRSGVVVQIKDRNREEPVIGRRVNDSWAIRHAEPVVAIIHCCLWCNHSVIGGIKKTCKLEPSLFVVFQPEIHHLGLFLAWILPDLVFDCVLRAGFGCISEYY